jgi:hypothetical protein
MTTGSGVHVLTNFARRRRPGLTLIHPPIEGVTMPRYLVLVPRDGEWHAATRGDQLVTTTERAQIALRGMEGRRPPLIVLDADGPVPSWDLVDLLAISVQPTASNAGEAPAAGSMSEPGDGGAGHPLSS